MKDYATQNFGIDPQKSKNKLLDHGHCCCAPYCFTHHLLNAHRGMLRQYGTIRSSNFVTLISRPKNRKIINIQTETKKVKKTCLTDLCVSVKM